MTDFFFDVVFSNWLKPAWKRKSKSSSSNSKTSEEMQTALQRPPLLQRIPDGSSKLHIKSSEYIGWTTPLGLESFAVLYQVVHYFIVLRAHTHITSSSILNLLKCDRAAQWPDIIYIYRIDEKIFLTTLCSEEGMMLYAIFIFFSNIQHSIEVYFKISRTILIAMQSI
jgi:hypothetical protein